MDAGWQHVSLAKRAPAPQRQPPQEPRLGGPILPGRPPLCLHWFLGGGRAGLFLTEAGLSLRGRLRAEELIIRKRSACGPVGMNASSQAALMLNPGMKSIRRRSRTGNVKDHYLEALPS